jgi:hypothetical protein
MSITDRMKSLWWGFAGLWTKAQDPQNWMYYGVFFLVPFFVICASMAIIFALTGGMNAIIFLVGIVSIPLVWFWLLWVAQKNGWF